MAKNGFRVKNKLNINPSATAGDEAGDLVTDSGDSNKLKHHNGSAQKTIPYSDEVPAVVGSSTDHGVVRFNGTTGAQQDSGVTISDTNDLVVPGDLTVNGTTTTVNTATLDVTDVNITINNTGNQATADDTAGITVEMSDATDAVLIYDKDATSKWKAGETGSEVEIATISGAQVITAKDIDGGTASNTSRVTIPKAAKATLDGLTRKEATLVYGTDTAKAYVDDGVNLVEVGSGSGGGRNYVKNSDAEGGTADVTVSDTNATTGIVHTQTATNPIFGSNSHNFAVGTGTDTADYFEFDCDDVDEGLLGTEMTVSFRYATDANYTDDDVEFVLRDLDGAADITINATSENDGKLKATGGLTEYKIFQGRAWLDATNNTYAVRANVLSAPGTTSNIKIDDVKFGDESFFNVPIVGVPENFTPNFTNFTLGNGTVDIAKYWRVGNFMKGHVKVTLGSTSSMSTGPTMTIPDSKVIDTNISESGNENTIGRGGILDSGTGWMIMQVFQASTTTIGLKYRDATTTPVAVGQITSTVPLTWTTGDAFDFWFEVPITGWDAGALLSTTQANDLTPHAVYEITASTANTSFADNADEVVDYDSKIKDTHNAVTTGASWKFTAPAPGIYLVTSTWTWNDATNLTYSRLMLRKNGSNELNISAKGDASSVYAPPGTTTVDLEKGDYIDITVRQDDSAAGARDVITSATNAPRISIVKIADFTHFGVYGKDEYQDISVTTLVGPTVSADTWLIDATSAQHLTLTPGTWLIGYDVSVNMDENSGTTNQLFGNVGIFKDAETTPQAKSVSVFGENAMGANAIEYYSASRQCRVTLTSTATFKLGVRCTDAAANGIAQILSESITGSLTNPDNESVFWAERKR